MGRGLVGDEIRANAAPHELRDDLGRIAEKPDRHGLLGGAVPFDQRQGLVEVAGLLIEVTGAKPEVDRRLPALDRQRRRARQGRGQGLRAAHAAEPGRQDPAPRQRSAVVAPPGLDERFVGALHDALRADVDPGPGRHLAVHHQAFGIELVEMLPARPVRHEVRIGDQHARRVGMSAEHADRLAGLHEKGLVVVEPLQRRHDGIEARPIPRRPADPAIDHELFGVLGHLRIEIVHQHAHRRFGQPALGRQGGAAGTADLDIPIARVAEHGLALPQYVYTY